MAVTAGNLASPGSIAYLLKRVYSPRDVENAVYKDNPALALLPKAGGFTGESHVHAIRYRDQLGRSPDFATALSRGQDSTAGVTKGVQFLVDRVKNYQLYTLETEAILAGRDDKGSLLRTLTTEVDSALNNLGRDMGIAIYGAGYGELGQVTNVASTVFTVGEAVTNFEVGMVVVPSNGSTVSAALRSNNGSTITVVDRDAGTITVSSNADTVTTGDWLFIKGDRGTGASPTKLKIAGFEAWNPQTAPVLSSDSFFNVDRGVDPTRLAGLRLDISALTPEEGLVTALHRLAREGGRPSHVFMNFQDSKNIHLALGSKAVTEYMSVGDIGFSTIRITGPKGDVRIVPDQNAPVAIGRIVTMDTWQLKHLGDLFNTLDMDGSSLSREYNADRFEGRVAFYGNMVCYAPHANMRVILPS